MPKSNIPPIRDARLTVDQVEYLNGLLDGFRELSNGAWQAACETAIRDCGEFDDADPFDVWIAWCLIIAESQLGINGAAVRPH